MYKGVKIILNKSNLYKTLVFILKPIFKLIYRLKITGLDNIPKNDKAILCPNHTSNADPILLATSLNRQVFFMSKKELFKNKLLEKFFKSLGAFPVNRGTGDTSALDKSKEILNSGNLLGLFIEGTRSKSGEFLRPKTGAAMISYETKSNVIPIYIRCIDGGKIRPFKKNVLVIGKPLSSDDLDLNDTPSSKSFRNASRYIMDQIKKLSPNK